MSAASAAHGSAGEFLFQFALGLFGGQPARVAGGQELRFQQLQWDLDAVADRDVGEVAYVAALSDSLGQLVDVLATGATGETHDHRGVECLAGSQRVERVGTVLVCTVLESARRHRAPRRHRPPRRQRTR